MLAYKRTDNNGQNTHTSIKTQLLDTHYEWTYMDSASTTCNSKCIFTKYWMKNIYLKFNYDDINYTQIFFLDISREMWINSLVFINYKLNIFKTRLQTNVMSSRL